MPTGRFRVINSEFSGMEFTLPDRPVIIGRSQSVDIVIPHQSVSREHVRAELKDGHCILTDLGSHNRIVVGDQTLSEAILGHGDRFELGDVAIEFTLNEAEELATASAVAPAAAPASATLPAPAADPVEQYPLAEPAAERPVYIDDVFGPAADAVDLGPGEEEEAAVEGARTALKYVGLLAVIVTLGGVAWYLAGRSAAGDSVRPLAVIVKVRERKVIDLGIVTQHSRGRISSYVDGRSRYTSWDYVDADGEEVAWFELHDNGFMATIKGRDLGSTDVRVRGPDGHRRTIRILVRGVVPRPHDDPRITDGERVERARLLVASGRAAYKANATYRAMRKFEEATQVLGPVRGEDVSELSEEAHRLYIKSRQDIDERFNEIRKDAVAKYQNRDRIGALKALQRLRDLIADPNDRRRQVLRIIYNRTVDEYRRRGR